MTPSTNPISLTPTTELKEFKRNARLHSDAQVQALADSITRFGFIAPILVDGSGEIIAGHGRYRAAAKLGLSEVPTVRVEHLTPEQARLYRLADNRLAELSEWDPAALARELQASVFSGLTAEALGFDPEELARLAPALSETFEFKVDTLPLSIPLTSVLSARRGEWQARKRQWLGLGLQSELGRGDDVLFSAQGHLNGIMASKGAGADALLFNEGLSLSVMAGKKAKVSGVDAESLEAHRRKKFLGAPGYDSGASVFDPVLCELIYTSLCPANGVVLDPFAGGSVRGVVASKLELVYLGHELRAEQVHANRRQANLICTDPMPTWEVGDSRRIRDSAFGDASADLLFSCPPYADLEVYSDDPDDISSYAYTEFIAAYTEIIHESVAMLRDNAYAVFVVGEVRDHSGAYYDFVGDTVRAFVSAGCSFRQELLLVTAVGSLPVRAGRQFAAGRKIGKTHQNVLIFSKGNPQPPAQFSSEVEL